MPYDGEKMAEENDILDSWEELDDHDVNRTLFLFPNDQHWSTETV